ncbi:TraX family protein [Sporosalibacterium faouarense]|uniref:TraX family protein n=1 Tax=Sporosalibacterium faouarense TaxID=516123 RepID=UPI00192A9810|nr:TraX family protein [Sporosalibacterium faouarense]
MDKRHSDSLKLMAVIFMVVDHVGVLLYPDLIIFRIIGRLSFPIFAYLIALGADRTKNITSYIIRLLMFGVLVQEVYVLVFGVYRLNIFFTLAFGLLAIYAYKEKNILIAFIVSLLGYYIPVSYSLYGVITILIFYIFKEYKIMLLIGFFLLNLIFIDKYTQLQLFSMFSLVFIFLESRISSLKISFNKYLFYGFYPIHLIVLYLIKGVLR